MSDRRICVAVFTIVMALAASAIAQDGKNELGGIIGRTFISDQGIQGATFPDPIIHSGKGLSFDIEYARRFLVTPLFSLSAEGVFMYDPKEKLNAGAYTNPVVPTSYSQFFLTPALRFNLFPTTAVSPWVSFGGGFGHISESSTLIYGGTNPGKSTTSGALQGGAGLDVKAWRQLSIRGEVRDFWGGEPDYPLAPTGKSHQHNFFVGGGAYWRF
jgi:hypothetical protein